MAGRVRALEDDQIAEPLRRPPPCQAHVPRVDVDAQQPLIACPAGILKKRLDRTSRLVRRVEPAQLWAYRVRVFALDFLCVVGGSLCPPMGVLVAQAFLPVHAATANSIRALPEVSAAPRLHLCLGVRPLDTRW